MADKKRNHDSGKVRQIELDPNRARRIREHHKDSILKQERRRRQRRRKRNRLLIILLVLAVIIGIGYLIWQKQRTYHSLTVKSSLMQEDQASAGYRLFDGRLLKIGSDGVTFMSIEGDVIWKESYSIQNPMVDVNGQYAVIAGKDDTQVLLYNLKGKATEIKTTLPVSKVRVSDTGMLAVIMADEQVSWIRVYNEQGEMVAESKSTLTGSGYPVDVAISADGLKLMVAYHSIAKQALRSQVAFYQFGSAGKTEVDNLVSGTEYREHVVPEVRFLNNAQALALRDDGFSTFEGSQIPVQKANIEVENEIEAICYDDSRVVVLTGTKAENGKQYQAVVYDMAGREKKRFAVNGRYTSCQLIDGKLVMVRENTLTVMTLDGKVRFSGDYSSPIRSIFAGKGAYSYVIIGENTIDHVKLK
ncbi:MAG: DUF5711 family protein [Lachnospiraceae bacterium]|nr:DUF5711 family protein [Lachnospiraceae bacterium]MDY5742223.1 DUF5711 family protein [Lachnospiraceae bacterium]